MVVEHWWLALIGILLHFRICISEMVTMTAVRVSKKNLYASTLSMTLTRAVMPFSRVVTPLLFSVQVSSYTTELSLFSSMI